MSVGCCLIVSGRQGYRHCGRWGGWRLVSKSPPCASVSIVRVVVVTCGTVSTVRVTGAIGGVARSSCLRGVVTDVFAAMVLGMILRVARCDLSGGTTLGFELMACDVVFADFNSCSGP